MTNERLLGRLRVQMLLLAALAYIPLLLTKPGRINADTKVYLYLDPGRLLGGASSLWQPDTALGTVTHQNIGYLWPSGPFYWLFDLARLPDWFAQRVWVASMLFAAALGVLFLLQTLGWWGVGTFVSAAAYMLSPYVLDYTARISIILLPWVALPWLIAFAARSLRNGGWRYPAMFALVAFTAGGTNATSLILVGIGPVLFIVHEVLIDPAVTAKRGFVTALRIGLLTFLTSLWWIAGLLLQGRLGLPVLDYTETYDVVASAATGPEVLRGLGLWYFYGSDKLGPWIEASSRYAGSVWLIALSYLLPMAAMVFAGFTRFRHRAFFVGIIVVGGLIAVGSHPYDDPSVLGGAFKAFTKSEAGLALRSTPRAVPLVVLGTSVLLGAGVSALSRRLARIETPLTIVVVGLIAANMTPLFLGEFVDRNLDYEEVPGYWNNVAATLDREGDATRVLEVPGSDFSTYRWGNTVDPVTPGLMSRPYVARELVPSGTPQSAALVIAIDRMFQEGIYDPDALVPLARLLGVGDIAFRADLQYERYRTPRPKVTFDDLSRTPGLAQPVRFGETSPNMAGPEQPLLDGITLATADLPDPPSVAVYPVENPVPIVRAVTAERPLLMAGGAEGLVAAAGSDLLTTGQAILYSASFVDDPAGLQQALRRGADLVVTDSNRRRATRWGTIRENDGVTERSDEEPLRYDPTDNRLDVFPDQTSDHQTVAVQRGVTVSATAYGNGVTYTPENRAAYALDGNPSTAWTVAAFGDPKGERLVISLEAPTDLDQLTFAQPGGEKNRWITEIEIRLDGEATTVALDDTSRTPTGQIVQIEGTAVETVEIEITGTNLDNQEFYSAGIDPVGFAEIGVGGVTLDEWVRAPVDLLAATDNDLDHRLTLLFTRERANAQEPVREDPELALKRLVDLPSLRSFDVAGEARISADADEDTIDRLLGLRLDDPLDPGLKVDSSAFLEGDLASRGRSAFDEDTTTAWQTPFGTQSGQRITLTRPAEAVSDNLRLDLMTDGLHSVPTKVSVIADGNNLGQFDVTAPLSTSSGLTTVEIPVEDFAATTVEIVIDEVDARLTKDWYSGADVVMPVGIVEVRGLGSQAIVPLPIDTGCRDDLLTINGVAISARVRGTYAEAVERHQLNFATCDTVDMAAGTAEITTTPGTQSGLDVDGLVLSSERGGAALRADRHPPLPSAPDVTVHPEGRTGFSIDVGEAATPYWLVLGQSQSDGWHASGLGDSKVIDGYANGWLVEQTTPRTVSLRWTPQRVIWIALILTGLALIAVVGMALRGLPLPIQRKLDSEQPRLLSRKDEPRGFLRWGQVVTALTGIAVFALLNLPAYLPAAVAVALVMLVGLRGRRWELALPLSAAASLGVAGAYILISQVRNDFETDFVWPQRFEDVHVLGVMAMVLLAAEVIRSLLVDEDRPRG